MLDTSVQTINLPYQRFKPTQCFYSAKYIFTKRRTCDRRRTSVVTVLRHVEAIHKKRKSTFMSNSGRKVTSSPKQRYVFHCHSNVSKMAAT